MDFQIVEVSLVEGAPGAIRHVLEAIRRIDISHALITDGNDDLVFSLDDLVPRFTDSRTDSKQALYVALHPDCTHEGAIEPDSQLVSEDIIGYAYVYYPLADNLQTAHTNLKVDPDWEELGIGLALLNVVEKAAGNQNRSIFQTWFWGQISTEDDALRPPDGPWALEPDRPARFALAAGYSLEQVERHSIQRLDEFTPEPASVPGYRFVTFHDHTPEELLDAIVSLNVAMSIDAPSGGLSQEASVWTRELVIENDQTRYAVRQGISTVVLSEDGEPAGFTELMWDPNNSAPVFQNNTLVVKKHRGHGLAIALKQLNAKAAKERWPLTQRIHTWNAAENDFMWSINERLGYETAGAEGVWQKIVSRYPGSAG